MADLGPLKSEQIDKASIVSERFEISQVVADESRCSFCLSSQQLLRALEMLHSSRISARPALIQLSVASVLMEPHQRSSGPMNSNESATYPTPLHTWRETLVLRRTPTALFIPPKSVAPGPRALKDLRYLILGIYLDLSLVTIHVVYRRRTSFTAYMVEFSSVTRPDPRLRPRGTDPSSLRAGTTGTRRGRGRGGRGKTEDGRGRTFG
ncbi:hypothetical protein K438DRAFT_70472 [Mycena galopus ATCC 62051]|nr:hypothetical protein K438DRAFT_70472 [Mycena galopus ATCC 62051]